MPKARAPVLPGMEAAKLVYTFQPGGGGQEREGDADPFLRENHALHAALRKQKEDISGIPLRDWDRYKKLCNEYEPVFTSSEDMTSSTCYLPTSRSFFKLWEMLTDFPELTTREGPMQAAFLAEGPGGFVEAFHRFRAGRRPPGAEDRLHGMTLQTRDRRVPSWRVPRDVPLQVCTGADGTGNLYDARNVDALVRQVGAASCDLVTADGGFDFSHDFNGQESASLPLLWAETRAALRLQKPGGCFVLKVYDVSCEQTMLLIQYIAERYRRVHVCKPLTSRPANSEKYVVCCGYLGGDPGRAPALRLTASTARSVTAMNAFFVTRQIMYIIKTMFCVAHATQDTVRELSRSHERVSDAWCRAYGLASSRLKA